MSAEGLRLAAPQPETPAATPTHAPQPAPAAPGPRASSWAGLRDLHPAYFALVMATGIVSIAWHLQGFSLLPRALFGLNVLFYVALLALFGLRALLHGDAVAADLVSHGRSVGFFTMVAGTCVLGSQALLVAGSWSAATVLWALGILLWATLTYGIFALLTVKVAKPTLAEGINGGWLVAVVAAQSVAVLGAQLAPGFGARAPLVLFFCLALWLGGGMLYVWIIGLIVYRYAFFPLRPAELAPTYWINMGAVAISTLAGALLAAASPLSPLVSELLPFVKGLALLFWAIASGWIPMLVILGAWRHLYARHPLRYEPLYWGAVFPLGMYSAATFRLARVLELPFLLAVPRLFALVALLAWALTLAGLARRMGAALSGRSGREAI